MALNQNNDNPDHATITKNMEQIWNNTDISISNKNLLPHYIIIPLDKQSTPLKNIADFLKDYASDYTMTKPTLQNSTGWSTPKPDSTLINTYMFIPKLNIMTILSNIDKVKQSVAQLKNEIITLNKFQAGGNILPPSTPLPPSTNNNTREKMPKSANHTRKRERSRSKK
jgi:hypothetical protein